MTDKVSVKEIADELGIASKDVLEKAKNMGIEVKASTGVLVSLSEDSSFATTGSLVAVSTTFSTSATTSFSTGSTAGVSYLAFFTRVGFGAGAAFLS